MTPSPRDPATALGVTALAVAARLIEVGPPVQPLMLAVFLLVCPGAALVGNPQGWSSTVWWTAVVSASVSISMLLSTALLYAGLWSPDRVLGGLLLGSAFGSATHHRAVKRVRT